MVNVSSPFLTLLDEYLIVKDGLCFIWVETSHCLLEELRLVKFISVIAIFSPTFYKPQYLIHKNVLQFIMVGGDTMSLQSAVQIKEENLSVESEF